MIQNENYNYCSLLAYRLMKVVDKAVDKVNWPVNSPTAIYFTHTEQ